MSASHADMLLDFVRRIHAALNGSPVDICIARLCTPAFMKEVPAPLMWVTDLCDFPLGEARQFLDHDPAPDASSFYIIAEQRIDPYIAQYGGRHAPPDLLLWDMAAATAWKSIQAMSKASHPPPEETFLAVPQLEELAGLFCTIPPGYLAQAARLHYEAHMNASGDLYRFFAQRWAPTHSGKQQFYTELLCLQDTEAKTVSNAASFVRRTCGEKQALEFLRHARDLRKSGA